MLKAWYSIKNIIFKQNHEARHTKIYYKHDETDFRDNELLKSFAGIAYYENTFSVVSLIKAHYIDLGKVSGVSELSVNGADIGAKWFGKHIFDVSQVLKVGDNSLKIKITTTLGNYIKSKPDT